MTQVAEAVLDQVADIIRRVGKREKIVEEVAQEVKFGDLINSLLDQEGPIRTAAIKMIEEFLKNLEVESGSDLENQILDGVDFKVFLKELATDPKIIAAIRSGVEDVIKNNANTDDDNFVQTVDEFLGLSDAEKLAEMISGEDLTKLKKLVVEKVIESVGEIDTNNFENDTLLAIEIAVFTKTRIESALATESDEINETVAKLIKTYIENLGNDDQRDNPLNDLVLNNPIFKKEIDAAVDGLIRNGRAEKLVEQVAEQILSSEESPLRNQIQEAVSERLVDKIAERLVTQLFERRG